MRKKLKIIIVLFLIVSAILVSSGCWDALSINDRNVCTSVVMDKRDGAYSFYVEIVQIQGGGSSQESSGAPNTTVVKCSGPSFIEARNDLDRELNKPLFLGAVQELIITKCAAEEGINEYLYRVRDIQEYRKTMYLLITSAKPEDILNLKPENSQTVGFAVENAFDAQVNQGSISVIRLEDVLQKIYSTNDNFILSNLEIEGGQPVIYGYSVFHDGKDIGNLPIEESKAIAFLNADMPNKPRGNYIVPYDNAQLTVDAMCIKRDIKARYKDGIITFTLGMGFDGLEMYTSSSKPITDQDKKQVKQELRETIEKELADAIRTSQKDFMLDYLGFSEYFRTAYPDAYDNMNWDEVFPNVQFVINANVNIIPDKTLDYGVKRESK